MKKRGPTKKEIAEQFPEQVILRFKDKDAKDNFMSGLSDGWGENYCSLQWSWPEVKFDEVEMFGVDHIFDPEKDL